MSSQNIDRFRAILMADPALQNQLRAVSDRTSWAARAVELGRERGCDFSVEEVLAALEAQMGATGKELSDEQLAMVSGGTSGVWGAPVRTTR